MWIQKEWVQTGRPQKEQVQIRERWIQKEQVQKG